MFLITLLISSILSILPAHAEMKADKIVATIEDVDNIIQRIDFYSCALERFSVTPDCEHRIQVTRRDGRQFSRKISYGSSDTLNHLRTTFSSSRSKIETTERTATCRRMPLPHYPTLKVPYVVYKSENSDEIETVQENKLVLTLMDCTMGSVTRPTDDYAFESARTFRAILLVLGNEALIDP